MQGMPDPDFSFRNLIVPFTTAKAITVIILVGIIVYANMLLNGFVLDDLGQIVNNQSAHSFAGIMDIWQNHIQAQEASNYYRPLPYTFYTLHYILFQDYTFFYHFTQLLFHIGNTIFIYFILKKFLKLNIAFLIAILFLIIPINEETVAYIANLQDVLFVFFGLLSLSLLQNNSHKIKYILFADISLLLALFSKESGILFFAITYLYVYLFKKRKLLYHSIFSLFAFGIYVITRVAAHEPLQKAALVPIMQASFWERIINIPAIIFYYIKTFFYPQDLAVIHTWVIHSIQFNNFYLPLFFDVLFFTILFAVCFFLYKKGEGKTAIFFFSWFLLGLLIHLQIIPLDMTVADHYFYFPIIGLLALIGLFINKMQYSNVIKYCLASVGIIIVLIFSIRTIVRNTNWVNQSVIITHDEKVEQNDYLMELLYSTYLIQNNRLKEAEFSVHQAISLYPQSWLAWSNLGVIYMEENKYQQAKEAYLRSISLGNYYGSYENLALLMLHHDSPSNSLRFIKKATKIYPNSEKLWYYHLLVSYKLKNDVDALYAAQQYYNLKQDQQSYEILLYIQQKRPINIDF
jgi:hypothetical protein